MDNISVGKLNDLFVDTIQRCNYGLVDKDDETIEYELFEEFDLGAHSFLHEDSLKTLLKAKFINLVRFDKGKKQKHDRYT